MLGLLGGRGFGSGLLGSSRFGVWFRVAVFDVGTVDAACFFAGVAGCFVAFAVDDVT